MAKKVIKEKELVEFLHAAGCREITESDKRSAWYKKAFMLKSGTKGKNSSLSRGPAFSF